MPFGVPAEFLTIGDTRVHELPEVSFRVEYESKRNIDKKEASGKDDAVATDKGRKVRDLTIHMSWPDIARINAIVGPVVKDWDPGGPKGGTPFDFAHERNGLDMGDIKAVRSIIVEESKGPNNGDGDGVNTLEIKAVSWVKPSTAPGTAKTPEEKDKEQAVVGFSLDKAGATARAQAGGGGVIPEPTVEP